MDTDKNNYGNALGIVRDALEKRETICARTLARMFPESAELVNGMILDGILELLESFEDKDESIKGFVTVGDAIALIESQKSKAGISVHDFANKYSHNVWEELMKRFKTIENYSIGANDVSDYVLNACLDAVEFYKSEIGIGCKPVGCSTGPVVEDIGCKPAGCSSGPVVEDVKKPVEYNDMNFLIQRIIDVFEGIYNEIDSEEPLLWHGLEIGELICFFKKLKDSKSVNNYYDSSMLAKVVDKFNEVKSNTLKRLQDEVDGKPVRCVWYGIDIDKILSLLASVEVRVNEGCVASSSSTDRSFDYPTKGCWYVVKKPFMGFEVNTLLYCSNDGQLCVWPGNESFVHVTKRDFDEFFRRATEKEIVKYVARCSNDA